MADDNSVEETTTDQVAMLKQRVADLQEVNAGLHERLALLAQKDGFVEANRLKLAEDKIAEEIAENKILVQKNSFITQEFVKLLQVLEKVKGHCSQAARVLIHMTLSQYEVKAMKPPPKAPAPLPKIIRPPEDQNTP